MIERVSDGIRGWRTGAAVGTGLLILAGLMGAEVAGAAPRPTIGQVQTQVNKLQAQVDEVGTQYDQVTEKLSSARAKVAAVKRKVGKAEQQYLTARRELRQVAVAGYEDGSQSSLAGLLSSADPQQVMRQASLLQEMGNIHNAQADKFLSAAQQVAAAQAQYDRTTAGITQLQSQLAVKKQSLDKLLSKNQATLDSLTSAQQQQVAASLIGGGGTTSATDPYGQGTPALKAVWFAYQQLGKPYLWGGTGPGAYDCSGLTQAAWSYAGVSIPRDTYSQWAALPHISKASLQPGDLVFFESLGHMGIYVGNGLMIDAPRTGEDIRVVSIDSGWYAQSYVGAARVSG